METKKTVSRGIQLKLSHQIVLSLLGLTIDDLSDYKKRTATEKEDIRKFIYILRKHSDMSLLDLAVLTGTSNGAVSNNFARYAKIVEKTPHLAKEMKRIEVAAYGFAKPYRAGRRSSVI